MISEEEIEKLETTIEDYKLMRLNDCCYEVEAEMFIVVEKLLNEYKRQKEINKEHQKLNGELQQRITELENTLNGIAIQEMGTSDLYKED